MAQARRKSKKTKPEAAPPAEGIGSARLPLPLARSRWAFGLMFFALAYAFFAGYHTIFDFDMGWHLATGRYVVQHHVIPSTDVLSYTSPGAEWLYPPFAGVLFYKIFSAWGYAGLVWFCALGLVATIALLLKKPSHPASMITAALAIIAVPDLAIHARPRADLSTPLFFSVFLALLWRYRESGNQPGRAKMQVWLLPLCMLLWVNLHPGFVAGLGVLFAYVFVELLDLPAIQRRPAALDRLRYALPPLAITLGATLCNPYGPRIFGAALRLAGAKQSDMPTTGFTVSELTAVPFTLPSLARVLTWRGPESGFFWLAPVAVAVVALALWRRQFGAAVVLAVALCVSVQRIRYLALFAIVVVVVGGAVLGEALAAWELRAGSPGRRKLRWLISLVAVPLCALVCLRIADLASNRQYMTRCSGLLFGSGESWWFPERAANFVRRERLQGNVFEDYNMGGFAAWRLGPDYGDFIDGRNVSTSVLDEFRTLAVSSPDSSLWEQEADRRNINILFFSLARLSGVGSPPLAALCQSRLWRPVYMDEVSIVLLRDRPENRPWIDRDLVDCQTQKFVPPAGVTAMALENFYANAGTILGILGRFDDAKGALEQADAIYPDDPSVHLALAQVFQAKSRFGETEREYKTALSLNPDAPELMLALGRFYAAQERYAEASQVVRRAAEIKPVPSDAYAVLGWLDLGLDKPAEALKDFTRAEHSSPLWQVREDLDRNLFGQIAEGRAEAYRQLGDWQHALDFQRDAIQRTPDMARLWEELANIYSAMGQNDLADKARQRAHDSPQ